jgi:hypothetical protein
LGELMNPLAWPEVLKHAGPPSVGNQYPSANRFHQLSFR